MKVTRELLAPGVSLTAIQTDKFKSALLSLTLLTPLEEKTASVNALVPYVLRRGCRDLPTMEDISARLEELYGGELEPAVLKRGETQGLALIGCFLDDAYTLEGETVLEPAARLLAQLVLEPETEDGAFKWSYVSGEKENLSQAIQAQMNDKRQYAALRLIQEMCRGEAYGVDKLGSREGVAAATPADVWQAYESLLATAQVELFYCGSASVDRVKGALEPLTAPLKSRRGRTVTLSCQPHRGGETGPRTVVDHLDVTQGKLVMGFRVGESLGDRERLARLQVLDGIYGGTATSKLFMNVREKLSLCYYASSTGDSDKGLLMVSSGVEFHKMDQAQEEILAQLKAIQRGDFTPQELESARQAAINAYKSALDSPAHLQAYWLTAAINGDFDTPERRVEELERVTAEEVRALAGRLELDTVYRLMGKEG